MEKFCETCEKSKRCYFRGLVNPCTEWNPNVLMKGLRAAAKKMVGKAMSIKEGQFIMSCITQEVFSPRQIIWLRSLAKRFSISLS